VELHDKDNCKEEIRGITSFIEVGSEETGGIEKIEDNDIPIWKIVKLYLGGLSVEGILDEYSGLKKEEVRNAISYYYCNRRRITRQMDENEER